MSNAVATVAFLQGQAWAKSPDGSLRPLVLGGVLNEGEVLVTAQGAQVQLDFGDGAPVAIDGGQEVAMSHDFNGDSATGTDEALLDGASIEQALTVLEQGGDLLEELEETAAGDTGGGGSDGGHNFVRLTRVLETLDPQAFNYDANSVGQGNGVVQGGSDSGYQNRAPEVVDQTLSGNEDEVIAGQVIASDIENDTLTYSLTTGPVNGTLVLDAATGQFTFTPNANYNGSDSFVVTVTDSHGNSSVTTINLNIAPVNDAPVSSDINLTTDEDTPVSGQVIAEDIEGDTPTYSVSGQPSNGTVTLDPATGAFVYTPNADYNGSDSFVVTIDDGNGGATTSLVTIGINPVNDAPVSSDQHLVTDEDTPVSGLVVASDVDGNTLSYSVTGQPTNGTVSLNPATGGFVYTPNADYNGGDSFVVTINDGNGGTTTSLITIGVNPVNDAPVSNDQNLTTNEDTPLSGQVVASDVDGDTLAYGVSDQPAHGTVTLNEATGGFVYTPAPNYNGSDRFVVTISDGNGGTTTSKINIGVLPVNDAPVTSNLNLTTPENIAITSQVTASDVDGDSLSFSVGTSPAHGTVSLNSATGTFVYTPTTNFSGGDSFTVIVSDRNGGTATSLVIIGVTPVNHAPTARDDTAITDEATAVAVAVRSNDTDPDGDSLIVTAVTQGANGSVVIDSVTGDPIYTPNAGFTGTDSFTYTISDGSATSSATVTVTVNPVAPVNQAPVAVADSITVAEGGTVSTLNGGATSLLANDTDADGDPLTASLVSNPAYGSLTLNADGTFTYVHDGSETTTDSFTYKVNDGSVDGNTVAVTINVMPVNDAPVVNNDNVNVNAGNSVTIDVLANDTDAEGDTLTVTSVTQGTNGSVTIDAVSGKPVYTADAGFSGSDSFTYTISDGNGGTSTATVNVTVIGPTNIAPDTDQVIVKGDEDTQIVISLSGNDAGGTVVGFIIKSLPANGELYSDAVMTTLISVGDVVAGPVYFMPDSDWNGNTSFTYAALDDDGAEDPSPATVDITVDPVNDPGLIGGKTDGSVKEDTPAETSVSGILKVSDPDSGDAEFNAKVDSPGDYGFFSIDKDGNWTYTLDNSNPAVQALKEGETKFDTFSVSSVDGTSTTVTITIKGTNDAPIASDDAATVIQDQVLTLTSAALLGNDLDTDGDKLTITSVDDAVNGTVSIIDGDIVFIPTVGYQGPASFTYTISDDNGGTSTATVNVNVTKANTAPVANDDSAAPEPGTQAGLISEYFGYKEGPDGPNLTSIQQAYSFINGRSADTTFVATTFDYGAARSFVTGLGYGNNLQTFLGADAASLSTDPGNSSDAIIRMRGFVELDPGTYNFKVSADDGYQIRVDGVVVAEYNQNNALHITEHSQFTISTAGLHVVEIIYWDQGGYATLKMELSDNNGLSYDILSSIPTYQTSALTVLEDQSLAIPVGSLLTNDTDADGDALTVVSVQAAVNGSVALVGGDVVFTPAPNYSGPASFTYTISDGKGGNATATVSLVVAPVNDAPVAVGDNVSVKSDGKLEIPFATLIANDIDIDGDSLTMISVQDAINGTVAISFGKVVFTPAAGYEGPASFTYTVRDPAGATSTATVNVAVGNAIAPSIVVAKTLLAIAHGTGGTSVSFPLITKLVDTDGSESLSIKISGVTGGLSFSAGTNLGSGVWQFTEADLTGLMLNIPGSFNTGSHALTVAVTSTEANGGFTATTSTVVSLKATYTHVDITTTESGSFTGNNNNEFIQGGAGDNVINAGGGNNIIYGNGGNDVLSSGSGSDIIYGGSGDDTINSGWGTDRIIGGAGNDIMTGGGPGEGEVDVFVWTLGDQGTAGAPAIDTINNFATAAARNDTLGGDVLDLRDLLQGESIGPANSAGNLTDYLHFEVSGGNTIIHVSHTGGFDSGYASGVETQQIILTGVDLQSLYSATTDHQIITQLLNNYKLITD